MHMISIQELDTLPLLPKMSTPKEKEEWRTVDLLFQPIPKGEHHYPPIYQQTFLCSALTASTFLFPSPIDMTLSCHAAESLRGVTESSKQFFENQKGRLTQEDTRALDSFKYSTLGGIVALAYTADGISQLCFKTHLQLGHTTLGIVGKTLAKRELKQWLAGDKIVEVDGEVVSKGRSLKEKALILTGLALGGLTTASLGTSSILVESFLTGAAIAAESITKEAAKLWGGMLTATGVAYAIDHVTLRFFTKEWSSLKDLVTKGKCGSLALTMACKLGQKALIKSQIQKGEAPQARWSLSAQTAMLSSLIGATFLTNYFISLQTLPFKVFNKVLTQTTGEWGSTIVQQLPYAGPIGAAVGTCALASERVAHLMKGSLEPWMIITLMMIAIIGSCLINKLIRNHVTGKPFSVQVSSLI